MPKRQRESGTPKRDRDSSPKDEPSEDEEGSRAARVAQLAKAIRKPAPGGRKPGARKPGARKAGARKPGERKPPGTLEKAFTRVLAIVGAVIVGVIRLVQAGIKALAPRTAKLRRRLATWIAALSRIVTPTRGLLIAALGCALLLALSQFVDYRGISIGADAYDPGISAVAPAPEVERKELGSAHSYAMIPVAVLAVLALMFAVRTGRWQLCRLAVLLGIVAILVAIFIDRPAGLDEGELNRDFTGVEAKLLGGFWMQIFAGAGLAITSFLLAGELKRSGAPARRRSGKPASRPKKPRRTPAAPKAEGAGA